MGSVSLKILAVDDEQLLLYALERAGKGRALSITTAATTEEASQKLDCSLYDLFLLDFDMNDANHLELLREIDERCPYVPIIFMTTSDTKSSELNNMIRSARKQGAWHLLEKPFRLDKMINFIDAIFLDKGAEKMKLGSPIHNFEQDKRQEIRRHHVQPVHFSYKMIIDGEVKRVNAKGILTDISDCGSGVISPECLKPGQLVSFEESYNKRNGVVAWSTMIENETCRFGVQFC